MSVAVCLLLLLGVRVMRCEIGPSATAIPFMKALVDDVRIVNLLSAGVRDDGYVVGGIMDGLGALEASANASQIVVLMNHELKHTAGVTREHGARGAYVSRVVLERETLAVVSVEDFLRDSRANGACDAARNGMFTRCSFDRLCSGDLPPVTALFNSRTGRGTQTRIFLTGEEGDSFPRALAFIVDGPAARTAVHLRALGSMRFENVVLCPFEQDLTIAAVSDDQYPSGFAGVYVGTKRQTANAIDSAGLTGGTLYAFAVDGFRGEAENSNALLLDGARFSLVSMSGADGEPPALPQLLRDQVRARNATLFARPEDMAWHPLRLNELLLVASDQDLLDGGRSRLWSFVFDDIAAPLRGGTVRWLINGLEGANMLDNVAIDARGVSYLAEDSTRVQTFNNRFLELDTRDASRTGAPRFLAEHDREQFASTSFDAEFSGQIDVSHLLGDGWMLVSSQAHSILLGNRTDPDDQAAQLLAVRVRQPDLPLMYDMRVRALADGASELSVHVLDADVSAPWTIDVVADGAVEQGKAAAKATKITMLHSPAAGSAAAKPESPFRRAALAEASVTLRLQTSAMTKVAFTLTGANGATRTLERVLAVTAGSFEEPNNALSPTGVALVSVFGAVFGLAIIALIVCLVLRSKRATTV
jgi:hypothetical protein